MLGTWNPATYRERAKKWREEAETLPPGKERDACMGSQKDTRTSPRLSRKRTMVAPGGRGVTEWRERIHTYGSNQWTVGNNQTYDPAPETRPSLRRVLSGIDRSARAGPPSAA